jgi:hypothetical protein
LSGLLDRDDDEIDRFAADVLRFVGYAAADELHVAAGRTSSPACR